MTSQIGNKMTKKLTFEIFYQAHVRRRRSNISFSAAQPCSYSQSLNSCTCIARGRQWVHPSLRYPAIYSRHASFVARGRARVPDGDEEHRAVGHGAWGWVVGALLWPKRQRQCRVPRVCSRLRAPCWVRLPARIGQGVPHTPDHWAALSLRRWLSRR